MSTMRIIAAVAAALSAAAPLAQAQEENWAFEIGPYLWAAGVDGDVTVANQSVKIENDFQDILEVLDIGGGLAAGMRLNHFVAITQLDYLKLETDEFARAPASVSGQLESELFMGMLALGFRAGGPRTGPWLDVMFGLRTLQLENTLALQTFGTFESDHDYVDPIVMLNPSFPLGERWRFNVLASYGEWGDSEQTWEVQPLLQFQISDHWNARVGYRVLEYDIDTDRGRDRFDGGFEGFILGIGGTFGGTPLRKAAPAPEPPPPAPVAAAPAPPPPPPPPPPQDTDGDGVTDNLDKCPNTARGEKVDPVGCAYNVRLDVLFDTNSATLQSASYAELDRIVEALNSTPTLSAIIEGHTDSSGAEAYNQALSERRAKAVADYLIERGINANRLQWKGLGESQPIADNTTAEGRALNRRVVLRRPDAD